MIVPSNATIKSIKCQAKTEKKESLIFFFKKSVLHG